PDRGGRGVSLAGAQLNSPKAFPASEPLGLCACRNLLVNLGLFAAGVWVARNLTDIDLMAPQPVP
uniref:TOM6 protein n=1 Tax=Ficedula albicollis TaxID=59894 RepID=A0A803VWJ3_FICAL